MPMGNSPIPNSPLLLTYLCITNCYLSSNTDGLEGQVVNPTVRLSHPVVSKSVSLADLLVVSISTNTEILPGFSSESL